MTGAHIKQLTPFVLVADLERSIRFYEDILGFECTFRGVEPGYAFLRWGPVAIRLLEVDTDCDLTDERRQQSIYIDVDGIDELYAALAAKLDTLAQGRVRPPFNQSYGQREFHVIDEDALLIFFGEPLK